MPAVKASMAERCTSSKSHPVRLSCTLGVLRPAMRWLGPAKVALLLDSAAHTRNLFVLVWIAG